MGIQIADDEPAAVEIHDRRQMTRLRRTINPCAQCSGRAGNAQVFHAVNVDNGIRRANGAGQMLHQCARFLRGRLRQRFRAGARKGFEKAGEVQIECHDITL
ncbi:hypothetical protein QZM52_17490 [Burkholderia metallica]|uniref:Uncharacterized protein n=1 Tax=Burkholderia metallica TaxID=488729 RepID=A0ABT8PDE3_9BURK|nr:hypothetical protein [Burkholderia metallica]MDN7933083.1 hypothetical protein [Burkholderia metallica]